MKALPEKRGGPIRLLLPLAVMLGALVVLISRRPDQWFSPQFWAEDGMFFFADAANHGWKSVFFPYAGYLHLVPRVVACATIHLPWEFLPMVYAIVAGVITAAVVTRVVYSQTPLVPRIAAACAIVAVPHTGEVFLNITNINWILGLVLIVNLLEPAPETPVTFWRRSLEVLTAGFSGAVVLVLFPFALFWAWRWRRVRSAWPIVAVWAFSFLVQLVVFLNSPRATTIRLPAAGDVGQLLPLYSAALSLGSWVPYSLSVGVVVAALWLLALGSILLDSTNQARGRAGLMLVAAALLLAAGRAGSIGWPNPWGAGARFVYLPLVLLIWASASLAVGTARRRCRILASALCALPIVASTSAWSATPLPQLNWPAQVREAREGKRTVFEIPPRHRFPVPKPTS